MISDIYYAETETEYQSILTCRDYTEKQSFYGHVPSSTGVYIFFGDVVLSNLSRGGPCFSRKNARRHHGRGSRQAVFESFGTHGYFRYSSTAYYRRTKLDAYDWLG